MVQEQPIIKIGAVVVNALAQVLIIKPKPKTPGEDAGFVLPRGSRQYQDVQGAWQDARDMETAMAHLATLEPFTRALAREIEEEAGVCPDMLARAQVRELGAREFQSRTKGQYLIHWFVVVPAAADAAALADMCPQDALEVRWADSATIQEMVARGEFSAGYVPVIEEVLDYTVHTRP